jgi:acetylornithine deacetylase
MDSLVRNLKNFIAFKSESFRSNAPLAYHAGRVLKKSGFKVSYQKIRHRGVVFVNVVGVKGSGRAPLVLCAHLDTVPAGQRKKWTATGGDPWKARLLSGNIYGLGSADDKGPLVSMIEAGKKFSSSKLNRPLVIAGTFGEESTMLGAQVLARLWKKSKPCLVIAGEPTDLEVVYRHKGIGALQIELEGRAKKTVLPTLRQTHEFHGKSGHSSRPWTGKNALEKAVRFLKSLLAKDPQARIERLEGGHAVNLIPDKAVVTLGDVFPAAAIVDCHDAVRALMGAMSLRADRSFRPQVITSNFGVAKMDRGVLRLLFDFRLLPAQSMEKIFSRLEKNLSKKLARYRGLGFKIKIERDHPPLGADKKDPLPQKGLQWLKEAGLSPVLGVKSGCTEAGIYARMGIGALVFGPGKSLNNIHAPNERVPVSQLKKAVNFYAHVIQKVCVEKVV